MSYQDDLDWLAKNVHEWPFGLQSYIYVITASDGMKSWGGNVLVQVNKYRRFDKEEWLARRAELQNKPSWDLSPEWAEWLGQDADGVWYWHAQQPNSKGETARGDGYWLSNHDSMIACRGELLGDWRDTLERRPADLSEPAVIKRLDKATQTVLAAVPGLMDEKYRFDYEPKPADVYKSEPEIDTSAECVEKSAESVHDWYERGALPPVGMVCEAVTEGCEYEKCEILAFHKGQVALRWFEFNGGCLDVLELDGWSFRPIRTERDELIEAIRSTSWVTGTACDVIADAIMAAGFTKGGET